MSVPQHRARLVGAVVGALAVMTSISVTDTRADAAPATRSHIVTARGKEPRQGYFVMVGGVRPRYHYKRVVILKQRGRTGKWQVAGAVKTDGDGVYRTRIYGPQGGGTFCWTARVPATPGFRTSYAKTRACVTR